MFFLQALISDKKYTFRKKMGLDLFHVKLIAPPVDSIDFFYLDQLEGSPLLAPNLPPLVANLVEATYFFTIYIFQRKKYRNYYTSRYGNNENNSAYLVGNLEELAEEISKIETDYYLDTGSRSVRESQLKDTTDPGGPTIFSTQLSYPVAYSKRKVIYYQEAGYQRKGMDRKFYSDFGNYQLYFSKDDVINAERYLDTDFRPDVADHFKTSFIDNFVEGESVFYPSW
ncbi:hypothetical protein [Chitinophaga polysaccharea]|uniref:hypothetical protein n=1 Tax=Chitinophaga polysaccharea TaxID=1293035 RepID=UPI00115C0BEF|nr:hypothetical protein [Chitinophaga polysaccharea]